MSTDVTRRDFLKGMGMVVAGAATGVLATPEKPRQFTAYYPGCKAWREARRHYDTTILCKPEDYDTARAILNER